MSWRLKLITFLLLLVFTGLAFFYIRIYVAPKPHGVILIVCPGLDWPDIARVLAEAPPFSSVWTEATSVHLLTGNANRGNLVNTLSIGTVGPQNAIGLDTHGEPADNLTYAAQRRGRTIGLVTSGSWTSPYVSPFFAHVPSADDRASIGMQIIDSTRWNILLGGTPSDFQPALREGRNIPKEAELNGYQIARTPADLHNLPTWRTRKLFGIFRYPDALYDPEAQSHTPPLVSLTTLAIECLQYSVGGYFLVVVETDPASLQPEPNPEFISARVRRLGHLLRQILDYTDRNAVIFLVAPAGRVSPYMSALEWAAVLKGGNDLPAVVDGIGIHHWIRKQF